MKRFMILVLLLMLNAGLLHAGEIRLVRAYDTWKAGVIRSTDPAGIVYHAPSGHMYIADSEINEIAGVWNCENIFEVNLTGDQVYNTYDVRDPGGKPCPPLSNFRQREPTGITYSEYDGYFYIADDDEQAIMRYDETFGAPIAVAYTVGSDVEGITCDPVTGNLYVVVGQGFSEVLAYSANLEFLYRFPVEGIAYDPEGIAYDSRRGHLFLVSGKQHMIYEFTLDGNLVDTYDIGALNPRPVDAQGLTFGPSSDPYDDPDNFNLYIADGQVDNDPIPDLDRDGMIYETEIVPAAEILPFDFLVEKKFKLNDRHGNTVGIVHSNENIEIKKGNPSSHDGSLTALKDIKIEEKNTVNGDVTAGNNLDINNNATINGTATGGAAVAYIMLPEVSFSAGGSDIQVAEDEVLSLAPGSYGNVEVKKRATLQLSNGNYYLKKLKFDDESMLSANVTGGHIVINVVDEVEFKKNARVDIIPSGADGSEHLTLKQLKDHEIQFDDGARFWGSVIAPIAKKVKLEKFVEFKGSIIAKEIEVNEGSILSTHDAAVNPANKLAAQPSPQTQSAALNYTGQAGVATPAGFELSQNYPNPFNPETTIRFQLPQSAQVSLTVYNVLGQQIRTLATGQYPAGVHSVRWDSRDNFGNPVSSGMYFYLFRAGEFSQVKKMSLMR